MPLVAAVLCVVDCSVGIAWLAGNGVPWGQELQHLVEEARRRGVLEQDGHLPDRRACRGVDRQSERSDRAHTATPHRCAGHGDAYRPHGLRTEFGRLVGS